MPKTDHRPSLWTRVSSAVRSYTVGPLTSRSPELAKYFSSGAAASSGVTINEQNIQSHSAVWAAVGLISDDVASLPLMLYKRLPNGGKDRYESHPLYRLLHDEPNPEMGTMVWRRTMQAHVLIYNNAYSEIERDRVGRPVALWPLVPERVRLERARTGELRYLYTGESGGTATLDSSDVIHLVGRSHDGTVGGSIVDKARESIGLAIAAERFGATFFGNGATFGGVISFPGAKPNEMSDQNYRDQLERRHQGVERAHKLLALYNGAKFEETGTAPDNAQFLETRTFQIREVARWFKIPPHKLADLADATFSNVEQMNTEYFVSAIRPWLVLWEQELSRKLIFRLERQQQFIEHSIEGFLRGDSSARSEFYSKLFNLGALTINEIRGFENLDPVVGGDQSFVQVNNLMPLAKVADYADAMIEALEKKSEPAPMPAQPDTDADEADDLMRSALASVESRMAEHAERLAAAEAARTAAEARAAASAEAEAAAMALATQSAADAESVSAALAEMTARHESVLSEHTQRTVEQRKQDEQTWQSERAALVAEAQALAAARSEAEARAAMTAETARVAELARVEAEARAVQIKAEMDAQEARDRQAVAARFAALRQAHRSLIVDALERLIQREIDRARKQQATPEKLRAWVDAFYQAHVDTCRAVLQPVIRAWSPCVGLQADAVLSDVVGRHVARSRADLASVLECEDAEDMAGAFARMCAVWERDRAQQMADDLLTEGERHGH